MFVGTLLHVYCLAAMHFMWWYMYAYTSVCKHGMTKVVRSLLTHAIATQIFTKRICKTKLHFHLTNRSFLPQMNICYHFRETLAAACLQIIAEDIHEEAGGEGDPEPILRTRNLWDPMCGSGSSRHALCVCMYMCMYECVYVCVRVHTCIHAWMCVVYQLLTHASILAGTLVLEAAAEAAGLLPGLNRCVSHVCVYMYLCLIRCVSHVCVYMYPWAVSSSMGIWNYMQAVFPHTYDDRCTLDFKFCVTTWHKPFILCMHTCIHAYISDCISM